MTALYTLTSEFQEAIRNIGAMQERGEIDAETADDTIEGLGLDLTEKMRNVGLHCKNLRSDLDQLVQAKAQFDDRLKAAKAACEWYEGYLYTNMIKTKHAPIADGQISIRVKPMPDLVEVTGSAPLKYSTLKAAIPATSSPDKRAIKKALDAGEELPFAHLIKDRTKLEIK
tara:strand:- start:30602 stop:31114 length:513 start_codon:yes stop_codon:yes gene_type:complete